MMHEDKPTVTITFMLPEITIDEFNCDSNGICVNGVTKQALDKMTELYGEEVMKLMGGFIMVFIDESNGSVSQPLVSRFDGFGPEGVCEHDPNWNEELWEDD